jgi:MFS-type transporter involved in bile tolerance (Atg22 family)
MVGWITDATGSTTWATVVLAVVLLLGVGLMVKIPGKLVDK